MKGAWLIAFGQKCLCGLQFGSLQTLVETWDGTAWTLQPSPNPGTRALLEGVSCGASQLCTAVGQALDAGGVNATLIESGN
jgi:hypothetical protein